MVFFPIGKICKYEIYVSRVDSYSMMSFRQTFEKKSFAKENIQPVRVCVSEILTASFIHVAFSICNNICNILKMLLKKTIFKLTCQLKVI